MLFVHVVSKLPIWFVGPKQSAWFTGGVPNTISYVQVAVKLFGSLLHEGDASVTVHVNS